MDLAAIRFLFAVTAVMIKITKAGVYTISPTPCLSCVLLSEFVVPSSNNIPDISLAFTQGTHSLTTQLYIRDKELVSFKGALGKTIVECSYTNDHWREKAFMVERVSTLSIENITFVGCSFRVMYADNTYVFRSSFLNI